MKDLNEKHAALAAYAYWCLLEKTGATKNDNFVAARYKELFNHHTNVNRCPACTIALNSIKTKCIDNTVICMACPIPGWKSDGGCHNLFFHWQKQKEYSREKKVAAGNVALEMRGWCISLGLIKGD